MASTSTLEQIEADLLFCENVLSKKINPRPLAGGRQRPSSTAPASRSEQHLMQQLPPPPPPPQQHSTHRKQQQQQQQQSTPRKQLAPSPLQRQHGAPRQQEAPSPLQQQQQPMAKTTEELLTMLTSVPEGQPFEVDTRLLYSPESSSGGETSAGHDSPADSPGASDDASGAGRVQFSLPAYRQSTNGSQPLFSDIGQAASVLSPLQQQMGPSRGGSSVSGLLSPQHVGTSSWRSQQHAAGPQASPQDYQQQQWQQRKMRPASAPLRGGGGGTSGSRPARQLLLDDAAQFGVQGRTADLLQQGRERRLEQLAQPRTELWQRCAHIKMQEEQDQMLECTFAPRTGRPPSRHHTAAGLPVGERLQLAQAGKQEALEQARAEREREALAGCTFAPRLVTQPERHLQGREYTPVHRRLGEEGKKRNIRLAQARLLHGLNEADLTFQPQLNQRSLKLAAEKEARDLYAEPSQLRRPGSAPRSGGGSGDHGDFTFSPAINPTSERLLEDSSTVPTDFQERMRYYSMRRQAKERAASAAADAEACTFRPDTGNAVQVLALSASRAGNLLETEQERYERLALEEAARQAARRAAKEAEIYGGMDFKPQLNPRSLALAPAGSGGVEALASADKRQRKLEELQRAEEERRRAECTFRPNTSKPRVKGYYDEYQPPAANAVISIASAAKQGFDGLTQRISEYQADREARAAAAKAEEEAKKMRECSFAPDINRRRVQAKGPVVVRGLERVLELKQLAEKQRAEAEERAAKVFNQNPRGKQGVTVPKPFQLAGHALLEAKAAEKQAALLESTLEQRAKECPFRPQTNTQKRQEQLARILAQPSLGDLGLVLPARAYAPTT